MKYFKILLIGFGVLSMASTQMSGDAQAQNYYVGANNNSTGATNAPIYNAPTSGQGSSSPLMLNQMIQGSYDPASTSTSRYTNNFSGSSQKYSLGQSPEQIAGKRARADAQEKENQREADAIKRREAQIAQNQQTDSYRDQIGAQTSNSDSDDSNSTKTRVYRYNPVSNDVDTPRRVFNSLR